MANDEQSPTISSMTQNPVSRKYDILTDNQMPGTNLSSKLPSLLSKSSVSVFTPETTQFRKHRKKQKKSLTTSSFKIERQTTNIQSKLRLPTLGTTSNDNEQKRQSEFQRRQIYALNHLMRDLEQEKFRQFCKLDESDAIHTEEILPISEDSNKQESTE